MADFTSNTQLSAPQGAGTQPLAPIQKIDTISGLGKVASSIFESFGDYAKAEKDKAKFSAEEMKNKVLSDYTQKENNFAQAIEQGAMSPAEALSRSRANFRSFSSNYPEYTLDFEKQAKALKGNTEIGEAQKAIEEQRSLYMQDKSDASKAGFTFFPGMSKETEAEQIRAHKAAVVASKELTERRAIAAEQRAQGTYNADIDSREEKDKASQSLNNIAGSNLQAYQSFVVDLGKQVRSGKMSPDQARALNMERYSNISSGLLAVSRTNPGMAAPFEALFKDIKATGDTLFDPKMASEDLSNQLKTITTKSKLVVMSDPQARAAVLAYELFPNSPTIIAGTSKEAIRAMAMMASTDPKSGTFVPQVLGDPNLEPQSLALLREGVKDMAGKSADKKEVAITQASNSANQLLTQANKYLDGGVDPKKMVGFANFVASEEYATLVNSGKLDAQAAQAAKKVFQASYEKTMIEGVNKNLTGYLFNPLDRQGKPSPFARIEVKDSVDVKFTGAGISFVAKPLQSIYPTQPQPLDIERRNQAEVVNNLNASQKAINKLIHIGAHMEGTTDYAKYWEANKHLLLPSMFAAPKESPQAITPAAPAPATTAAPAGKNWWEE